MGYLRFYRRKQIFPGLRLNFSKRGVSASVGVRGAHVTLGRPGVRTTVGVPGTGLYYTSLAAAKHGRTPPREARNTGGLVRRPVEDCAAALLGRQQMDGL